MSCRLSGHRLHSCDYANEQLQREGTGELIVVNEATGESMNLSWMKAKAG